LPTRVPTSFQLFRPEKYGHNAAQRKIMVATKFTKWSRKFTVSFVVTKAQTAYVILLRKCFDRHWPSEKRPSSA